MKCVGKENLSVSERPQNLIQDVRSLLSGTCLVRAEREKFADCFPLKEPDFSGQ